MTYGLAICAGGGGLELGLSLVLGSSHRVVCYVEREAYAAATLVTRMAEGALADAPVWDDLTTFTGDVASPFVDKIDLLSGGIPCQPHSVAGNQRGADDDRDLWPQTGRLIREIRPRGLFLENVPGIARYYWERIRPELHDMDYETAEGIFSAAEVGANHRRERFFLLAYSRCFIGKEFWGGAIGQKNGIAQTGRRSATVWRQDRFKPPLGPTDSVCGERLGATDICRSSDDDASRVDRLAMLGNGVVPLQAAYAFRTLNTQMKDLHA